MHRVSTIVLTVCAISVSAQAPPALTTADYARAEKFMGYNVTPLVDHGSVRPNWLPNDRFWYLDTTAQNTQFIVVDAATGARTPAFDHGSMAAPLPFTELEFPDDRQAVLFTPAGRR